MLLSKATYSRLYSGYTFFYQYVYSLGIEPTTFCMLTQCSTTEPQEHYITYITAALQHLYLHSLYLITVQKKSVILIFSSFSLF